MNDSEQMRSAVHWDRVSCRAKRRFPDHRHAYHLRCDPPIGNRIHLIRISCTARCRPRGPGAHQLCDQYRVGFVISKMVVVGGLRVEIEGREIALRPARRAI